MTSKNTRGLRRAELQYRTGSLLRPPRLDFKNIIESIHVQNYTYLHRNNSEFLNQIF